MAFSDSPISRRALAGLLLAAALPATPALAAPWSPANTATRTSVSEISAWWIALFAAIGLIVLLPIIKPDPYLNILRFIPDGIVITFEVTVLSISLAIVIGLLTGLGRISRNRFINLAASLYVEVVRGIPLLVQLFYIYL